MARSSLLTGAPVALTPHQLRVVRAVVVQGNQYRAADFLGLRRDTVRAALGRAFSRARSQGYRADCLTDLLLALGWLRVPGAWA